MRSTHISTFGKRTAAAAHAEQSEAAGHKPEEKKQRKIISEIELMSREEKVRKGLILRFRLPQNQEKKKVISKIELMSKEEKEKMGLLLRFESLTKRKKEKVRAVKFL